MGYKHIGDGSLKWSAFENFFFFFFFFFKNKKKTKTFSSFIFVCSD